MTGADCSDPFDHARYQLVEPLKPGDKVLVCVMDYGVMATWRPGTVMNANPRWEGPRQVSYPVEYISGGKAVTGYFEPRRFQVLYDRWLNLNSDLGIQVDP